MTEPDYIYLKLSALNYEIYVKHDRDELFKQFPGLQSQCGGRQDPDEIHKGLSCYHLSYHYYDKLFLNLVYAHNTVLDSYKLINIFKVKDLKLNNKRIHKSVVCFDCDVYDMYLTKYKFPIIYVDSYEKTFDKQIKKHNIDLPIKQEELFSYIEKRYNMFCIQKRGILFLNCKSTIPDFVKAIMINKYTNIEKPFTQKILWLNAKCHIKHADILILQAWQEFTYESLNLVILEAKSETFIECKMLYANDICLYEADTLITNNKRLINESVNTLVTSKIDNDILDIFPNLEIIKVDSLETFICNEIKSIIKKI